MSKFISKKIAVGMSGGVDSSVAAFLLKQMGHEVVGFFMKNWDDNDPECPSKEDFNDVRNVCEQLDIPYYGVDFVDEYYDKVFSKFVEDSKKGLTPNPDILCNKEIKFNVFLKQALNLGMDYLATGHYSKVVNNLEGSHLAKGIDRNKDQSYFLYAVDGSVLDRVLFPLGDLTKQEVREIAKENKIPVFNKKDSTGICFVGERKFKPFLMNYINSDSGNMIDADSRKVVGKHDGLSFYTIGQRKGLGVGGPGAPYFVLDKNLDKNELILARGVDHPGLFRKTLKCSEINFINDHALNLLKCPLAKSFDLNLTAKIRYRQNDQKIKLISISLDEQNQEVKEIEVEFETEQRAITLGQSIVFYHNEICLGGGIISQLGENQYLKTYHQSLSSKSNQLTFGTHGKI